MLRHKFVIPGILVLFVSLAAPMLAAAQVAPTLGNAKPFAVLGGSTVTNTGASVITGDLGVSPGAAVTGFPPGVVQSGTTHAADATAASAQADATTAYLNLAGQATTSDLTGQDLGGMTLVSGVYNFASSAQLTGTLTLNAAGNANAVFIFKIGSTLTTASNARVLITNGGSACNVFWQVGSSATLGTSTSMQGTIIALTSITANTTAAVVGRLLARNGAVTLDTNTVNASGCTGAVACPAITLSPATLPNGGLNTAYSQQLTASGGTAPYTFSVQSGALPAGITLGTAGLVSGTPSATGTASATIQATDAVSCPAVAAYTLTVLTSVPTLPEIVAIALTLAMLTIGALGIRRRQTPAR